MGRLVHGGGWRFLWVGGLGGGIFWEVVGGCIFFYVCVKVGGARSRYVLGRSGGVDVFYRSVGGGWRYILGRWD